MSNETDIGGTWRSHLPHWWHTHFQLNFSWTWFSTKCSTLTFPDCRVTLNAKKCDFCRDSIQFLDHIINCAGVHPDPEKISAILKLKTSTNILELHRFLGMVNQLGKFSPNLASSSQFLRELLCTKRSWIWDPEQQKSFSQIKTKLTQPAVLMLYNPTAPVKVSADASAYGMGAVLLQQANSGWKPVAYTSRAMSEAEKWYAQIEKRPWQLCEPAASLPIISSEGRLK